MKWGGGEGCNRPHGGLAFAASPNLEGPLQYSDRYKHRSLDNRISANNVDIDWGKIRDHTEIKLLHTYDSAWGLMRMGIETAFRAILILAKGIWSSIRDSFGSSTHTPLICS